MEKYDEFVYAVRLPSGASATITKKDDRFIPRVKSSDGKLSIKNEDDVNTKTILAATRWILSNIERVILFEPNYDDINELALNVKKEVMLDA